MKKIVSIIAVLIAVSVASYAQNAQLSFRLNNPQIRYLYDLDQFLEFDIEVKASDVGANYLLASQIGITFNELAFQSNAALINQYWYVEKGDLLLGSTPANKDRYQDPIVVLASVNNTKTLFLSAIPDTSNSDPDPGSLALHFNNIPTNWTVIYKIKARILDPNTTADIRFVDEVAINEQFKAGTYPAETFSPLPDFDWPDFTGLFLGRIYANNTGWSQYGGTVSGQTFLDWSVARNTSIWSGSAILNAPNLEPALVQNLNIFKLAGLFVPSNKWLTVTGIIDNNAGVSGITIGSTVSGDGSLLHYNTDVEATIERYITGQEYHFVSVPLTQSSNPQPSIFANSYLFRFRAEDNPQTGDSWVGYGNQPFPITVNQGYMIWHVNPSTTLSFKGKMNSGSFIAFTPTIATDNYAFVPNPYPSAIDWESPSGWTKTNLYDAIFYYNPSSGNYAAYIGGVGVNGGSRYIAMGQAFFVQASGNTAGLSMNNNVRVHNNQMFYKNRSLVSDLLFVKTHIAGKRDEIAVCISEVPRNASKITGSNNSPQLYTTNQDGRRFSIRSIGADQLSEPVPLHFSHPSSQTVNLEFEGIESFDPTLNIYLEDLFAEQIINLREQQTYSFWHQPDYETARFLIHFGNLTLTHEAQSSATGFAVYQKQQLLHVRSLCESELIQSVTMVDAAGRLLGKFDGIQQMETALPIPNVPLVLVYVKGSSGKAFTYKYINK